MCLGEQNIKGGIVLKITQSKYSNCKSCPLLDNYSCTYEISNNDLPETDIVFIAENPGKEEVNREKPVPLVGRAGRLFRKFFEKYGFHNLRYLLTNVVWCLTLNEDETTGNPTDEVINICKENCFNLIRIANPKLIVLLGTSAMKAFGIAESNITKYKNNIYKWEGYDVFLTYHPSYVNRNKKKLMNEYDEDFKKIGIIIDEKLSQKVIYKKIGEGKPYYYKIPEEFYSEDYRLVDIQHLIKKNKIVYIFRDKNNKKIYHLEDDDMIFYLPKKNIKSKKILLYRDLEIYSIPFEFRDTIGKDDIYEGDISIEGKHAIDYFHQNKGEAEEKQNNIMFCDIEVHNFENRDFPDAEEAKHPIVLITSRYNGKTNVFVYINDDRKIIEKEGRIYHIFHSEKDMIKKFVEYLRKVDPDFISGWNFIGFDMLYISNRMEKFGLRKDKLSNFRSFYINKELNRCLIPGMVVLDQLEIYKRFSTKKENYKLDFIAEIEIERGKKKLSYSIFEVYEKDINNFIEYNVEDVLILEELEKELLHIDLVKELKNVCNTSVKMALSSFLNVDSLVVSFLKRKGFSSINSKKIKDKIKYPGAYVLNTNSGVYNDVVDFDFKSLYPSLIMTYNIGIDNFAMKFVDQSLGYTLTYDRESLPEEIDVIISPLNEKEERRLKKKDLLELMKIKNFIHTINGCFFFSHKEKMSVFTEILQFIISSRVHYKEKMLEAEEKEDKDKIRFFYQRQLTFKTIANAIYGVFGNKHFRFFDISLASAITLSGQEVLKAVLIKGDSFMESLKNKIPYVEPKPLTKEEMYSRFLDERTFKNIILGDTDSIFCCFEDFNMNGDIEKVLKYCDHIQKFLNIDVMNDIINRHNVEKEFSELSLKNELYSSRGLFLTKKRYSIRVLRQEGKIVDKIINMGIEIKRSDYPSKTKEFLGDLLEIILKREDFSLSNILKFIENSKKEFEELIDKGDVSVAKPVSYGRVLSKYKSIPQAVRGMENWNKIVYKIHTVGTKAYLFRILGIDEKNAPNDVLEKYNMYISNNSSKDLNAIAIPIEEGILPHYFIRDKDEMMRFSFYDRYNLLLKPILKYKTKEKETGVINL